MTAALLILAGSIYLVLGALHGLYTLLDIADPRRIVPDDPAVIAAMQRAKIRLTRGAASVWQGWIGFNFSHSLGALLFGGIVLWLGLWSAVPSAWLLLALTAWSALYLGLAVLYWFRIPIVGTALATACLLVATVLAS